MFITTTEVAPHVRVSKTVERVAHYAREGREHKKERRQFNAIAAQAARRFSPLPRLVKRDAEPSLNVIDFHTFRNSRPVDEEVEVVLIPQAVVTFDKREAVAREAGL